MASEFAWKHKDLNCFLNFSLKILRFRQNLMKDFASIETIENWFTQQHKRQQYKKSNRFVVLNRSINFAYDLHNKPAVSTTLESKNFKIYSFLRSKGFTYGFDVTHHNELYQSLGVEKLEILKKSFQKAFTGNSSAHVLDILSRSRLAFDNDQTNFTKVKKLYDKLDEIGGIQSLLKVVANAETVNIVFDFNRNSVCGTKWSCQRHNLSHCRKHFDRCEIQWSRSFGSFGSRVLSLRTLFDLRQYVNANLIISTTMNERRILKLSSQNMTTKGPTTQLLCKFISKLQSKRYLVHE